MKMHEREKKPGFNNASYYFVMFDLITQLNSLPFVIIIGNAILSLLPNNIQMANLIRVREDSLSMR